MRQDSDPAVPPPGRPLVTRRCSWPGLRLAWPRNKQVEKPAGCPAGPGPGPGSSERVSRREASGCWGAGASRSPLSAAGMLARASRLPLPLSPRSPRGCEKRRRNWLVSCLGSRDRGSAACEQAGSRRRLPKPRDGSLTHSPFPPGHAHRLMGVPSGRQGKCTSHSCSCH